MNTAQAKYSRADSGASRIIEIQERARAEVRDCRRDPTRREASPLGQLTSGPTWKTSIRLAALRTARLTRVVLAICKFPAILAGKFRIARTFAHRVKETRDSFYFFKAAIEEAGGWQAFRREFAMRVPALCYHHVGTKWPATWPLLTVSPETFKQQIEWLVRKGYTGINAADWLAWLETGKALPEKPVLVTFDDAYADLVETAIPILEAHSFKATLFVVSQHIAGASTWDLALGYTSLPLMTAHEIRMCAARGIEIGAHTCTHPDLRKLNNAELTAEMQGCREELTALVGSAIDALAYPFGYHNERVCKRASEYYQMSFTCKPGLNGWGTEAYRLRRMFVHPSRINLMLQVKYGVDLHAMYRFVCRHAGQMLKPLSRFPSTGLPSDSVGRARPEDNL